MIQLSPAMKRGVKRLFGMVAAVLFFVGTWLSVRRVQELGAEVTNPELFIIVITSALLTVHLAAKRFQWLALTGGLSVNYAESAYVVVMGGIANVLPVPGAFLVRFGYLTSRLGVTASTRLNGLAALLWVAATTLVCAVFLAVHRYFLPFLIIFGVTITTTYLAYFLARVSKWSLMDVAKLFSIQLVMSMINLLRILLISYAINIPVSFLLSSLITMTGMAASMTGVFPGGLGLSEALAAYMATLLALAGSIGFILASVNRLVSWIALACFFPFVWKRESSHGG